MRTDAHECRNESGAAVCYLVRHRDRDDDAELRRQTITRRVVRRSRDERRRGLCIRLRRSDRVFPMFGISISATDNLLIAVIFTAVSIARSFTLRRLFEAARVSGIFAREVRV